MPALHQPRPGGATPRGRTAARTRNALRDLLAELDTRRAALHQFYREYPARYTAGNLDGWLDGGPPPDDIPPQLAGLLDDARRRAHTPPARPGSDLYRADILDGVLADIRTALDRAGAADAVLLAAQDAALHMRTMPGPSNADALRAALDAARLRPDPNRPDPYRGGHTPNRPVALPRPAGGGGPAARSAR